MEKMQISTWEETLVGETLFFGLLGKALYGEPDKAWLDGLIREDVFSEAVFGMEEPEIEIGLKLLCQWCQANVGGLSDEHFEVLKSDYLALFVGPGQILAPPWESVYFSDERLLFQKETLDVRQYYRRFGLEIEKLYQEPDDHIGLEMSFTSYLARLALLALEEGDEKKFEEYTEVKRKFLSEHLLRWGTSWCALVTERATTNFYRGMGHLVLGSLEALGKIYHIQVTQAVL